MSNWKLKITTSLPNVAYYRSDLKTKEYEYSSFEEARDAFKETIKSYALGKNTMFEQDGKLSLLDDYSEDIEAAWEDNDEEVGPEDISVEDWQYVIECFQKVFIGEEVDISPIKEFSTDWMLAIRREENAVSILGYEDGPYNGINPVIETNMFNMDKEGEYYIHIDDLLGQDTSSELYIDLTKGSECGNDVSESKDQSLDCGCPNKNVVEIDQMKTCKVGDIVKFGNYHGEGIEWQVLDVKDDKVLLITKYGIDSKLYDEEYGEANWEKCSLRNWLNGEFLNKAFNKEE